jgi:hypothetical protein
MAYEAEKAQVKKVRDAFDLAMDEGRTLKQSFPDVEIRIGVKDGQKKIEIHDFNGILVGAKLKVNL